MFEAGKPVGSVVVTLADAEVAAASFRMLWVNAACLLAILATVLALTGRALAAMLEPLRVLTDAVVKESPTRPAMLASVRTGDELQALAQAFNSMLSELEASMRRVRWLAFMDAVTRLPNRAALLDRLAAEIASPDGRGVLFLIELDRFRRLHDVYGARAAGDIMVEVAGRIRRVAKARLVRAGRADTRSALLARHAPDAFALFCRPDAGPGQEASAAREILDALQEPIEIAGMPLSLTGRIGIAHLPAHAADPEALIGCAALALDAARAQGPGSAASFAPAMAEVAAKRLSLEAELRRAVARNEFEVHYQPIVDARSGVIVGVEALARWRRDAKIAPPATFISLAEETGLIADIGAIVLGEACRAGKRWLDAGHDLHVAVNVSVVQFESDGFDAQVRTALRESALPPGKLELELTESAAMADVGRVIRQVEPLRARGVRFAIDDFGTGYSSLGSLTRLPFDLFKIDRSFVAAMDEDADSRVVIQTIIAMARALGFETVAEGVETERQFAFLRLNGVNRAQGYLFAPPLAEAELLCRLPADQSAYAPPHAIRSTVCGATPA